MSESTSAERWLPIPGLEGFYEASDWARVWSCERRVPICHGATRRVAGGLMKPHLSRQGYLTINLNHLRKTKRELHVLIALTFIGPRPPGLEVCHNDGNKLDCRPSNLRYDTPSNNSLDRVRHGTHHFANRERCPSGHLLVAPNLRRNALPRRGCLACNRAHSDVNRARRKGIELTKRKAADIQYQRIMSLSDEHAARLETTLRLAESSLTD